MFGKCYVLISVTAPGVEGSLNKFLFGPVWHLEGRLSQLVTDQELSGPVLVLHHLGRSKEAELAEFKISFDLELGVGFWRDKRIHDFDFIKQKSLRQNIKGQFVLLGVAELDGASSHAPKDCRFDY